MVTSNGPAGSQRSALRVLYTACPLCGDSNFPFLRLGDCLAHPLYRPTMSANLRWHRCSACHHVFTDGYFTPEAMSVLFGRTNPQQQFGNELEKHRLISASIVERVARRVTNGDWLDVGFGNGSLIFAADEFGFRASGIDLRAANVQELRRAGFEAECVDVSKLDHPGRYSVISMADVLEHMPFPIQGLQAAHRLLRPGGILLASMPNLDSAFWRAVETGTSHPYWGEIEHYHNFGRKRLYALLEEFGFTPHDYYASHRYRLCMEIISTRNG